MNKIEYNIDFTSFVENSSKYELPRIGMTEAEVASYELKVWANKETPEKRETSKISHSDYFLIYRNILSH